MTDYGDAITVLTDVSRVREGLDAVANQLQHSGPIMAMLGPFMFALDTAAYQTLRRQVEYRWPAQARIGRRPALQFVGIGGETIELNGVIYPEFAGGLSQVQAMRELAGLGKPLPLVDGVGVIYGEWAILEVEETLHVLHANGTARRIGFRLRLARYERDDTQGLTDVLKQAGGR